MASLSQPVRRLRGFERVTLAPGQTKTVSWRLNRNDVGYYNNRDRFVVENGKINVFAGNTSSEDDNRASFAVTGGRQPDLEIEQEALRLTRAGRAAIRSSAQWSG